MNNGHLEIWICQEGWSLPSKWDLSGQIPHSQGVTFMHCTNVLFFIYCMFFSNYYSKYEISEENLERTSDDHLLFLHSDDIIRSNWPIT